MAGIRYAILGLARPRTPWFTEIGRWTTDGLLPAEYVRCISAEEVRARLGAGRTFSALVVEPAVSGLDRDLIETAQRAGTATIVVGDGGPGRDWVGLGAAVVLEPPLRREDLLAALQSHASSLADVLPLPEARIRRPADAWRGRLIAVTGPGGTGASVLTMALAQALGDDARHTGNVVLADLRLRADQAMLHGAPDIVPGVSELVDAHRTGQPDGAAVRAMTFEVAGRGYHLLLGLRRRRDWAALRPRAVEAAIDNLAHVYRHVVADIEADVEGEAECGSIEVEERNALARTTARAADVVVVVGLADTKGVHSLLRTLAELTDLGVASSRLLPVINRAPRSPRARAELSSALAELAGRFLDTDELAGPLFIPSQRHLAEVLHDGARLPSGLGRALSVAVDAVAARAPARSDEPEAIAAGTLGTSWEDRAAG